MKYKILVDLESIKENKDYGSQVTIIPGDTQYNIKCKYLPKWIEDNSDMNWVIDQMNGNIHTKRDYTKIFTITGFSYDMSGVIVDPQIEINYMDDKIRDKIFELAKELKYGISFSSSIPMIEIHHWPISKYYYNYTNPVIKCNHCSKKFRFNDLQSDFEDDYYIIDICPRCGKEYCVDYEYEKIEDAIKRKNK